MALTINREGRQVTLSVTREGARGQAGHDGQAYTEPTDTPPTDTRMIWVTLAGVRCTYYGGAWVAIADTTPETGEIIAEKLSTQTIEPAIIVIPDFGASFGPVNALGTRGGVLALGNGEDINDLAAPRRVAGMAVCNLNGTNKASARFAIVGIPLTAAEVVAGSLVKIAGTVKLLFDDGFFVTEDPVISATIGFTHNAYKIDATTKWMQYNCLPTGTELPYLITNHIAGSFRLATNATPGPNKVVIASNDPKIIADRWGGVAGNTFTRNSVVAFVTPTDTSVAVTEEVADTLWLSVEIVMGASGTNGDINFAVVYDLDTAVTLP